MIPALAGGGGAAAGGAAGRGAAGSGAAGSGATNAMTTMMGATAITTGITSTAQGASDIMASNRNLETHKNNLDQQPVQKMEIPPITQK